MASMSFGPLSSWSSLRASPGGDSVRTWAAVFGARSSLPVCTRGSPAQSRRHRPGWCFPELLLVVDVAGTAWNTQVEDKPRYACTTARLPVGSATSSPFHGQVLRIQHRPRPGRAEQELCAVAVAAVRPGSAGMCRFQRIASGLAPLPGRALPGQGTTWFRSSRPWRLSRWPGGRTLTTLSEWIQR